MNGTLMLHDVRNVRLESPNGTDDLIVTFHDGSRFTVMCFNDHIKEIHDANRLAN
jgi:hypothetical protein